MGKTKYIDVNELRAMMYHGAFEEDSGLQRWDGGCWIRYKMFENALEQIGAADVVEVVRCKDCKYGDTGTDEDGRQFYKCIGIHYGGVSPTDYCSYGERKDG